MKPVKRPRNREWNWHGVALHRQESRRRARCDPCANVILRASVRVPVCACQCVRASVCVPVCACASVCKEDRAPEYSADGDDILTDVSLLQRAHNSLYNSVTH